VVRCRAEEDTWWWCAQQRCHRAHMHALHAEAEATSGPDAELATLSTCGCPSRRWRDAWQWLPRGEGHTPCGGNAGGYVARGRATRHATADSVLQAARHGAAGFRHHGGSGDTMAAAAARTCDRRKRGGSVMRKGDWTRLVEGWRHGAWLELRWRCARGQIRGWDWGKKP
jgi:hypothetical protein